MPPIKPMEPEDELITHIKSSLIGHEEEYIPGAWEKFDKKEKNNKRLIIWFSSLSGVAAMLLIGIFLFLQETPADVPQVITKNKSGVILEKEGDVLEKSNDVATGDVQTERPNSLRNAKIEHTKVSKNAIAPIEIKTNDLSGLILAEFKQQVAGRQNSNNIAAPISLSPITGITGNEATIDITANKATATTNPNTNKEVTAQASETDRKLSIQDFLTEESRRNKTNPTSKTEKTNNKWEMGLVVAPSFGNSKKLNMGYGLSMGYNLSERVSLNSGISYNDMAASSSMTASTGNNSQPNSVSTSSIASTSKNLESVEAKVSGIDIPLEIKYNLSKKLYANVGVSAFAIINQSQSNNYLQGTLVQSAPNTASLSELKTLQTERVSEEVPESEINSSNYIGFYNFSFGFRQKISKKNTFSVEPFMKVPMKPATTDNLRLIGTGVKLKFDF
jgi:hypothetical protein